MLRGVRSAGLRGGVAGAGAVAVTFGSVVI